MKLRNPRCVTLASFLSWFTTNAPRAVQSRIDGAAERFALLARTIQKLAEPVRSSWAWTLALIFQDGLDADEITAEEMSMASARTATLTETTARRFAPVDATKGTPFPLRTRSPQSHCPRGSACRSGRLRRGDPDASYP